MKKGNKKLSLFMMLVLLMTIVLSGCQDKRSNEETTTPTNDNISQNNLDEPTYGGSVIVGITQDIDSLDPHKAVAAGTREVLFNIFEGLVKPDKEGNLVPAVASKYELLDGAKTYIFTLREGIKFHDGSLVTVDDIIYSIKRCAGMLDTIDPEVVSISAFSNILEINAVDEKTVEVKLKEADTELIGYFTNAIVPEDAKSLNTNPVGTGPFRFTSYSPQQSVVVRKFDSYWDIKKPYLDEVTFKISSNTDAAFLELKANAIDIFPYLTITQVDELKDSYNIEIGNMNLVQGLFLNNNAEPFDNELVRQAMNYAINKQEIIDMVAGGHGNIIGTNMFHGFGKYYNSELENYYLNDVQKAKDLLKEAGYEQGFDFTITVPSNYQFHVDTAQVIVEQLKAVNINAKIQLVEWAAWLSDVYTSKNYQSTIIGLEGKLSPRDILERYSSTASNNFVNYKNETFDNLLKQAISSTDDNEKIKLYKEIQEILTKDGASVYLQDPALLVAVNKRLGGYTFYPIYVQDMASVYYKK